MRLGILTSHPIQYQAPWFRALAKAVDLFSGYSHRFLENVSRRPSVNHFSGCDTPEMCEIIRAGRFDAFIVTGWYLKSYWQAVRACRRNGVPVLVRGDSQLHTSRSQLRQCAKALAYRVMLRQFDGFLVVGQRNREYLAHYGVPAKRIFFVPHFVDNAWFTACAEEARGQRASLRALWGTDEDALVVLFVGKFQPIKRPCDILRALAELGKRGVKAIAVFVGAGKLERSLRTDALGIGVVARFEGFKNQSELPRYYASADVLVLPSASETWGLVVNEAMACGLPAIVSDAVGCGPDLIDEGKTGFTFRLGNYAELADRLAKVAQLKRNGHDFTPALASKINAYGVQAAVTQTVEALQVLAG